MFISTLIHLLIGEVLQEINTTQVLVTIFKEVLQIVLLMITEEDLQSLIIIELLIEIQLSNLAIQTLIKDFRHNMLILDKLKGLDLLRDHKFMDQMLKDSRI